MRAPIVRKFHFSPFSAGAARSGRPQTGSGNLEAGGVLPQRQGGRLSVCHDAEPANQDSPRWRNSLHFEVVLTL